MEQGPPITNQILSLGECLGVAARHIGRGAGRASGRRLISGFRRRYRLVKVRSDGAGRKRQNQQRHAGQPSGPPVKRRPQSARNAISVLLPHSAPLPERRYRTIHLVRPPDRFLPGVVNSRTRGCDMLIYGLERQREGKHDQQRDEIVHRIRTKPDVKRSHRERGHPHSKRPQAAGFMRHSREFCNRREPGKWAGAPEIDNRQPIT